MPQLREDMHKPDVYICDTFEEAFKKRMDLITTHSEWDARFQPRQLIIVRDFQDRYLIVRSV